MDRVFLGYAHQEAMSFTVAPLHRHGKENGPACRRGNPGGDCQCPDLDIRSTGCQSGRPLFPPLIRPLDVKTRRILRFVEDRKFCP